MDANWPGSLSHLSAPLASRGEDVVVAEISSEPVNGYQGTRILFTALVPQGVVADVLAHPGGIGWDVQSWGPGPCVDPGEIYETSFWIDGRDASERFETLTPSWSRHTERVVTISNGFLMCYGLVPRLSESTGEILWNDPSGPNLGVVRLIPLAHYDAPTFTTARVSVRRDYLEDFLSLKGCAAVAVFYEERYSTADREFSTMLAGEQCRELIEPGRRIVLQVGHDWGGGPESSEVWGSALLLNPSSRPITDARVGSLDWPEYPAYKPSSHPFAYAYIRDEVLEKYEAEDSYTVVPSSGSVGHGGWWGVSHCTRYGRNFIRVELRKLYEGAPKEVERYHKFAVGRQEAETDRQRYGDGHIGVRADNVVNGFLALVEALDRVLAQYGILQSVSTVAPDDVRYQGWWRMDQFRRLGRVVPVKLARDRFLTRCKDLYQILECLREKPLREVLVASGVSESMIKDYRSLKLMGTVCELGRIAALRGMELARDRGELVNDLCPERVCSLIQPLLSLNDLRQLDSHQPGGTFDQKLHKALSDFGMSMNQVGGEWGFALDKVYDLTSTKLEELARVIQEPYR